MSARQRRLRVTTVLVLFGFVVGCDSEFSPVIEQDLAVTAQFVEFSPEQLDAGLVPLLDGFAGNLEWGAPDDPQRAYTYVVLTPENGFGDAGAARFVAMKAAYTAEWDPAAEIYRLGNLYLVFQWADPNASQFKDSLIYQGPNLALLAPRILNYYQNVVGLPPNQAEAAAVDSMKKLFFTPDPVTQEPGEGLPRPENWRQEGRDDRLLVVFGDGSEKGAAGTEFSIQGMQVLRNGGQLGPLAEGRLDGWWWSASRSNPHHEVFNRNDPGGDVAPVQGFCGFAEDMFVDAMNPMTRDDGPELSIPNFDTSLDRSQRVPLRAWNPAADPNFNSPGQSACTQVNMGVSFPYLHRYTVVGATLEPNPVDPKIINRVPINWETRQPAPPRLWTPGDFVTGHLLGHDFLDRELLTEFAFCLAACPLQGGQGSPANCAGNAYTDAPHLLNALHVRAEGFYNPVTRHWVVEMARPLTSAWGVEGGALPLQDRNYGDVLTESFDIYVALALWDNAEDGGAYLGSPAIRVHFDPPPPRD